MEVTTICQLPSASPCIVCVYFRFVSRKADYTRSSPSLCVGDCFTDCFAHAKGHLASSCGSVSKICLMSSDLRRPWLMRRRLHTNFRHSTRYMVITYSSASTTVRAFWLESCNPICLFWLDLIGDRIGSAVAKSAHDCTRHRKQELCSSSSYHLHLRCHTASLTALRPVWSNLRVKPLSQTS
jgi:hypothetical protein